MSELPRLFKPSGPIAGLAILLAAFLFLLTQKLGCGPGWGGGAGAGPNAAPGPGNAAASKSPPAAPGQPETLAKPLQITIDDTKYLVDDVPAESVDELVKMAVAVPKDVPLPRVRVLLRPTARYVTEKKLSEALLAAKVDFVVFVVEK
ncbi:MAG: hypothetical protein ACLP9L_32955 [Thermoguttaceae bacterium]